MLRKSTQAYKNKLKYIREYGKTKGKRYFLQFHKEHDADIIERLESVKGSKVDYMRQLIRKDIENK